MESLFVNYAFITALYSEKHNFLETFSPFILRVLYNNNAILSIDEIREILKNEYELKIPINTLKTILKALDRNRLVGLDIKNKIEYFACINEKGKKEALSYDTDLKEINRKYNELIGGLQKYLLENNIDLSPEDVQSKTVDYINSNLSKLSLFESNEIVTIRDGGIQNDFDFYLTKYIIQIEDNDSKLYSIFQVLVKGSIIKEYISNNESITETEELETLTIYLDANFIISLLEFHHPTINKAAHQLYDLLRSNRKIVLKTFTITLEEIERLLNTFKYIQDNYNPSIPVNSIYYNLKKLQFDDIKIDSLINTLDRRVESLGINIEKVVLMDLSSTSPENKELYKDIYSFKNQLNIAKPIENQKDENAIHLSALHDSTVISLIKKKRGAWVKVLERSKAIFLTSSYSMDDFCKKQYKTSNNFPEVILDLTLTNILWLKNPNKDITIPLHKLIEVHSKRFIVDQAIWNKFVKVLKELNKDGKIDTEQYATVFSNNQLTLDYLKETDVDEINSEGILTLSKEIEANNQWQEGTINKQKNLIEKKDKDIQGLSETINKTKKEIEDLKEKILLIEERNAKLSKENDKRDFINTYLNENFYPLGIKVFQFLLLSILGLIALGIAEVFPAEDLNISETFYKIIRLLAFVILIFINPIINKKYSTNYWKYIFRKRALKAKMMKEAEKQYNSNSKN